MRYYYRTSKDYDRLVEILDAGEALLGYITKQGNNDAVAFFKDDYGRYLAGTQQHIYIVTYKESLSSPERQAERYKEYLAELEAEYIVPYEEDD